MPLFIYKNIQQKLTQISVRNYRNTCTKESKFYYRNYNKISKFKHLRNAYLSALNARIYIAW